MHIRFYLICYHELKYKSNNLIPNIWLFVEDFSKFEMHYLLMYLLMKTKNRYKVCKI